MTELPMELLGYKRDTLPNFYAWQGTDINPDVGTVNYECDFVNKPGLIRYARVWINKYSTVTLDDNNMPIIGTIIGAEQDVIWIVKSNCPPNKIPTGLLTTEQFDALDWRLSNPNQSIG